MTPTNSRANTARVFEEIGRLTAEVANLKVTVEGNCRLNREENARVVGAIKSLEKSINGQWKDHYKYHRDNEEKWGVFAWLSRHLKIAIIMAILAGMALVTIGGLSIPRVMNWYRTVNTAIGR